MPESREMNLYEKLALIRKNVEVIQTDKSGFGYKYVTDEAILARISGAMTKYHVSLVPSIVPGTASVDQYHYDKVNKKTNAVEPQNEILVKAEMTFSWINNDHPEERIDVPWALIGQQADASQALGSGLTYSMRYFLLKYFGIATPDDDPDNWRSKQKEAEQAEDKQIAAEIIKQLDTTVRSFIGQNPDKAADVKGYITGFVKSGDYFKIQDPALAKKLYDGFVEKFIKE